MSESQARLVRQWHLVRVLAGARYGLSIAQLMQAVGRSKPTIYRDLATLRDAGIPLASHNVNGEARHRLLGISELPPMTLTTLQVAALHLVRGELEPLAGTELVTELDALLAKLRPPERQQRLRFVQPPEGRPEIVAKLDRALSARYRAKIEYRAASRAGKSTCVHVEPLLLSVADRDPYLRAYCIERNAERTYKIARITKVELTRERCTYRPARPAAEAFAHSIKAWSGELTTVRVRLDQDVAWRAAEYPIIPEQNLSHQPDGSVVVEARVAGVVEASRWVLSWGGAAEAVEPEALRNAVRSELANALSKYDGPGPAKARRRKSTELETGRLKQAESRRA